MLSTEAPVRAAVARRSTTMAPVIRMLLGTALAAAVVARGGAQLVAVAGVEAPGPHTGRVNAAVSVADLAAIGSGSATTATAGSGAAPTAVTYAAPVSPLHVVRAFDPPATRYGAGHLGVDLASTTGEAVRAAADGVVLFAGSIAGRGVVVVLHSDGIRTEYEPLRLSVRRGTAVRRGQVLGVASGTHGTCLPGRCLHWGARRGAEYFDPLTLLHPLGAVRLLPWR